MSLLSKLLHTAVFCSVTTVASDFSDAAVAVQVADDAFRKITIDFLPTLEAEVKGQAIPNQTGEKDGGHYETSDTHITEFNISAVEGTTAPPNKINLQLAQIGLQISGAFYIYVDIIGKVGCHGNFALTIPDAQISIPAAVGRDAKTSRITFSGIDPSVALGQINVSYTLTSDVCKLLDDVVEWFADIKAKIAQTIQSSVPQLVTKAIDKELPTIVDKLPPFLLADPVATSTYMQFCFSLLAIPPPPSTNTYLAVPEVVNTPPAVCSSSPPTGAPYHNVMAWVSDKAANAAVASRVAHGYLAANMTRIPPKSFNTSSVQGLDQSTTPPCKGCTVAINLSWSKQDPSNFTFTNDTTQVQINEMYMDFLTFKNFNDTTPAGTLLVPFLTNFTIDIAGVTLSPLPGNTDGTLHFKVQADVSMKGQPAVKTLDPADAFDEGMIALVLQGAVQEALTPMLKKGIDLPVLDILSLRLVKPVIDITPGWVFIGVNVFN